MNATSRSGLSSAEQFFSGFEHGYAAGEAIVAMATVKIGCATDATNTILENTQTTDLTAAKKRERYIPNNSEDGLQTITVEISTGASATTAKGRFYFKGMLVEDE